MLAEYKKQTNAAIGLAIVAFLIGVIISNFSESEEAVVIGKAFGAGAIFPFVLGCCYYAKGKGYHGAWGLLGVFCPFGLIILICFPDRHKLVKEKPKDEQKQ